MDSVEKRMAALKEDKVEEIAIESLISDFKGIYLQNCLIYITQTHVARHLNHLTVIIEQ